MGNGIDHNSDVIDLRDVIARVEELREERQAHNGDEWSPDAGMDNLWAAECPEDDEELCQLAALLAECKGMGGDEQWEGDWYPVTLVRDSYFEAYAQELAEDIGAINSEAANGAWPANCIDWERAARELQQDYSSVEFDGITYWTR